MPPGSRKSLAVTAYGGFLVAQEAVRMPLQAEAHSVHRGVGERQKGYAQ